MKAEPRLGTRVIVPTALVSGHPPVGVLPAPYPLLFGSSRLNGRERAAVRFVESPGRDANSDSATGTAKQNDPIQRPTTN